jgi:uncharacterized lipoprotein
VSKSDFVVFARVLARVGLVAGIVLLTACRSLGSSGACYKPAVYSTAENRPPLKIPPELKSPDTTQALRIPALKEPEPPARKKGEPCLDAPPPYAVPKPVTQPAA